LAGKCLLTPQKLGFLGNLFPKMGCYINEGQKSTPLGESASFEPLSVKMWWTVWPVGELLNKGGINKKISAIFHLFAQKPPINHLGLLDLQNFIGLWRLEGPNASQYQISSKLVIPLWRQCSFSFFFQNGHRLHLGFLKSQHFIRYWGGVGRDTSACPILSNRSISCEHFSIFQDGGRRHLVSVVPLRTYCDFSNF